MGMPKLTKEQTGFALRQADIGISVEGVFRKVGVSQAGFYAWKKKYGGVGVSDLRRLRHFENEKKIKKRRESNGRKIGPLDILADTGNICPRDDWREANWDIAFDLVINVNVECPIHLVRACFPGGELHSRNRH